MLKVSPNRQITLPKKLCVKIGIVAGDYLHLEVTKEGLLLKPVSIVPRDVVKT